VVLKLLIGLTSNVDEEAAGGESIGLIICRALVPADVLPADGRKVEEAVRALRHWRIAIICETKLLIKHRI